MSEWIQQFLANPHDYLPLGDWVNAFVDLLMSHGQGFFDGANTIVETFAEGVENGLMAVPAWAHIALAVGIGFWRLGWRFALFVLASLLTIVITGFWSQTVVTFALTITATFISLVVGVPLGIACARSNWFNRVLRPFLDFMQTMPAFVYLIPAAMVFGLGRVPGIMATVVFAMPPVVRLTSLGIRQVNVEQIEAGHAFGCTGSQLLFKVQLPIALSTIMTGVNQTIMMALSMVIIASMVGAGGLGNDVLSSIQRLDVGLGFESGLAVVLLAIILDRITESFGTRTQSESSS